MVNAQEWLNQNYPKETRKDIEELRIGKKSLEGHLDLRDFINLEVLYCQNNKLTSLDLSQNQKLVMINAHGNWISTNLDTFSHLTNLGTLILSSTTTAALKQEEFLDARLGLARGARNREVGKWVSLLDEDESGFYCNDFSGSLEVLKNCQNLVSLSIKNQENIAGELKDLPTSLEIFNCEGTTFQQELEPFEYNFKVCRLTQEVKELEIKIEEEREIHQDAMKAIDNFYQQNPPRENLTLQNILKEFSNDYLNSNLENKQLRKENQELKERLKLLEKLAQIELKQNQQLEAKVEIFSLENSSKLK